MHITLRIAPQMKAVAASGVRAWLADNERVLWPLMLAPAILYIVLLVGFPFLLSLYYSLSDATVASRELHFVGLQNYRRIVESAHVLAVAEEHAHHYVRLAVLHRRAGEYSGGRADQGVPRQVVRAVPDPAAVGRADLARFDRLALDLRFHLQHHQLDWPGASASSDPGNGRSGSAIRRSQ